MENAVDSLFLSLNHRGGDATGIVAVSDDGKEITWQKASCDAMEFITERRNMPHKTRSVLVHTRMATQGSQAFPENNHPVRRGSVYIVHNGHVWNDKEIFVSTKRERFGQVDSEAIAAIIAKRGIMETHIAMEEIEGAAAIAAIDETRPGITVLARGQSSPLYFYHNEDVGVWGSTLDSVKRAWINLYGSAPKDKNIRNVDEGTALFLEKDITEKLFYVQPYGHYYKHWEKQDKKNDWVSWGTTTSDYYTPMRELEPAKEDSGYTLVDDNIYCNHGCLFTECIVCTPEEFIEGTVIEDSDVQKIRDELGLEVCELCGHWAKIHGVDIDEDEEWYLCDNCADEFRPAINNSRFTVVSSREDDYDWEPHKRIKISI